MRNSIKATLLSVTIPLLLVACKPTADNDETANAAEAPAVASTTWPASLNVVGDGFPNAGDPCRIVGESAATVNYLDDSATLAGCLSADDAAKLGGTVLATIEGVTLVSVPNAAATAGDGDTQGDALVPGTKYNATAQLPCSGYKGAPAGMCEAGVVRNQETGSYVEVRLPDGGMRTIMFNPDGSFLTFSTAQSDGTAAMKISSSREGDTTIAMLGTERYEIPDVLIQGD
jgi:hypothetical protein